MVKIGFDGKRTVQNYTGLGNYSRYIADIVCRFQPATTIYCMPKKRRKQTPHTVNNATFATTPFLSTSSLLEKPELFVAHGVLPDSLKKEILQFSMDLSMNFH